MQEKDLAQLVRTGATAEDGAAERQPQVWAQVAALVQESAQEVDALLARALQAVGSDQLTVVLTGEGAALNAAIGACGQLVETGHDGCDFSAVAAADLARTPLSYVAEKGVALVVALEGAPSPQTADALRAVQGQLRACFCLAAVAGEQTPVAVVARGEGAQVGHDALVLTLPLAGTAASAQAAAGEKHAPLAASAPAADNAPAGVASAAADKSAPAPGTQDLEACAFGALLLCALLMLDGAPLAVRLHRAQQARELGQSVVARGAQLSTWVEGPFDRLVFLGDGLAFGGAVREAVRWGQAVGLGAGAKPSVAFGDLQSAALDLDRTHDALAVCLVPSEPVDDRAEALANLQTLAQDAPARGCTVVALQQDSRPAYGGLSFDFDGSACLPAAYLALPCLMAAQQLGTLAALK